MHAGIRRRPCLVYVRLMLLGAIATCHRGQLWMPSWMGGVVLQYVLRLTSRAY